VPQRFPSLDALDRWFEKNKRSFPWREDPFPYAVLVSEIMLQQTQATRVIPFFLQWMRTFPSLNILAQASEISVIKAWEGLGYYRRARMLHKAASIIIAQHNGEIPQNRSDLLQIPGIGPYTAGAILSFAFHQRAAAVDANVRRVLFRLFNQKLSSKELIIYTEQLLSKTKPWHTMEALIELGALLCLPSPHCHICPLSDQCRAYQSETQNTIIKKDPQKRIPLQRIVLIFLWKEYLYIIQRAEGEIMGGLYEFPFFEITSTTSMHTQLTTYLDQQIGDSYTITRQYSPINHSFTQYRATLYPYAIELTNQESFNKEGSWIRKKEMSSLPFSAGHRRIFQRLF